MIGSRKLCHLVRIISKMKIKTKEELIDYVHSDLAWRKQEIAEITAFLNFSQLNDSTIFRISIPIFYAHFEGFTKNMCNALTVFLNYQNYKFSDLSCSISSIILKRRFNNVNASKKNSSFLELNNFVRNGSEIANFSTNSFLTYSNLTWEIFEDIMLTLGFKTHQMDIFKTKAPKINLLVELRNDIAHGKRMPVDKESFREYKDLIVYCMDTLKDSFESYLENNFYLEQKEVVV